MGRRRRWKQTNKQKISREAARTRRAPLFPFAGQSGRLLFRLNAAKRVERQETLGRFTLLWVCLGWGSSPRGPRKASPDRGAEEFLRVFLCRALRGDQAFLCADRNKGECES